MKIGKKLVKGIDASSELVGWNISECIVAQVGQTLQTKIPSPSLSPSDWNEVKATAKLQEGSQHSHNQLP